MLRAGEGDDLFRGKICLGFITHLYSLLHWKYFAIPFEKKTKVLADRTPEHTSSLAPREPTFRTSGPGDGKGKAGGTKHPLRQKLPWRNSARGDQFGSSRIQGSFTSDFKEGASAPSTEPGRTGTVGT